MILDDGTNRLFRNVNYQSTLHNIPEERKSHFPMMICDRWKQGPNQWNILKSLLFPALLYVLHWLLSGISSDVSCMSASCLVLHANAAEDHPFTGFLNCAVRCIRSWQDPLDEGSAHHEVSTNTRQSYVASIERVDDCDARSLKFALESCNVIITTWIDIYELLMRDSLTRLAAVHFRTPHFVRN